MKKTEMATKETSKAWLKELAKEVNFPVVVEWTRKKGNKPTGAPPATEIFLNYETLEEYIGEGSLAENYTPWIYNAREYIDGLMGEYHHDDAEELVDGFVSDPRIPKHRDLHMYIQQSGYFDDGDGYYRIRL